MALINYDKSGKGQPAGGLSPIFTFTLLTAGMLMLLTLLTSVAIALLGGAARAFLPAGRGNGSAAAPPRQNPEQVRGRKSWLESIGPLLFGRVTRKGKSGRAVQDAPAASPTRTIHLEKDARGTWRSR